MVLASLAEQSDPPRLGIIHLLIWTACVAVYLGITRAYVELEPASTGAMIVAAWTLYGIGTGAAWGGLVLLVARRRRGWVFPQHPGEWLLVALGMRSLYSVALDVWLWPLFVDQDWEFGMSQRAFLVYVAVFCCLHCVVFLATAFCVKITRWRRFLLLTVVTVALSWLLLCGGAFPRGVAVTTVGRTVDVALAAVLLIDFVQKRRYPWTHWLGIGVYFWFSAVGMGMFVWDLFSQGFHL